MKIFNFTYTEKYETDLTNDEGQSLYGDADHTNLIIRLNKSNFKQREHITKIHESLHGYNHQLKYWDEDQEERECKRMSHLFYNFIINNKEFIKEIINEN